MGLAKLRRLQQQQQQRPSDGRLPSSAGATTGGLLPLPPAAFLEAAELAWELRAAAGVSPRSARVREAALRMLQQKTQG